MIGPHQESLARLCSEFVIETPSRLMIRGRAVAVGAPTPGQAPGPWDHAVPCVARLTTEIYGHAYCRAFEPADTREILPEDEVDLSAVLALADRPAARGTEAVAAAQPGFYFVDGSTPAPAWENGETLRIYFHATSTGIAALLALWAFALDERLVPFRMKALRAASQYSRADACVLYLHARHWPLTARLFKRLRDRVERHVRPSVPLFAKRLAPGVGLAEDPGAGISFGVSRSRLVAEGLWAAFVRGRARVEERMQDIATRFAEVGVSLERPHLNAGSVEDYDLETEGFV